MKVKLKSCLQINPPKYLTLNCLQPLLGAINWVWPSLGIPTQQLTHLFNALKGDPDLNSPRKLSSEALWELTVVNQHIQQRQLTRINSQFPVRLFCFPTLGTTTGLIGQLSPHLAMIEWLFLSHLTTTYYYHLYNCIVPSYYKRTWANTAVVWIWPCLYSCPLNSSLFITIGNSIFRVSVCHSWLCRGTRN